MKSSLINFLRRTPYVLSVLVAVLTLLAVGCQPTAKYKGQPVTMPELQATYDADIRALELKAESLGASYEAQVAALTASYEQQMNAVDAEAEDITARAEVAGTEIQRKQAIVTKTFSLGKDILITAASGGTINAGETLATGLGLAGLLFGVGGTGTAVSALRKKKAAEQKAEENEDALVDVVTSLDKVKDTNGTVNFKSETVRARLEANQATATRRKVDAIRRG